MLNLNTLVKLPGKLLNLLRPVIRANAARMASGDWPTFQDAVNAGVLAVLLAVKEHEEGKSLLIEIATRMMRVRDSGHRPTMASLDALIGDEDGDGYEEAVAGVEQDEPVDFADDQACTVDDLGNCVVIQTGYSLVRVWSWGCEVHDLASVAGAGEVEDDPTTRQFTYTAHLPKRQEGESYAVYGDDDEFDSDEFCADGRTAGDDDYADDQDNGLFDLGLALNQGKFVEYQMVDGLRRVYAGSRYIGSTRRTGQFAWWTTTPAHRKVAHYWGLNAEYGETYSDYEIEAAAKKVWDGKAAEMEPSLVEAVKEWEHDIHMDVVLDRFQDKYLVEDAIKAGMSAADLLDAEYAERISLMYRIPYQAELVRELSEFYAQLPKNEAAFVGAMLAGRTLSGCWAAATLASVEQRDDGVRETVIKIMPAKECVELASGKKASFRQLYAFPLRYEPQNGAWDKLLAGLNKCGQAKAARRLALVHKIQYREVLDA